MAATVRVIDNQNGPVILVGHSWGGTVITQPGVHPNVAGLVYVAALVPDAGETTARQYEDYPASPEFVIEASSDGFGIVRPDKFHAGFAADPEGKEGLQSLMANLLDEDEKGIGEAAYATLAGLVRPLPVK